MANEQEKLTREEAIEFLTMQRDLMADAVSENNAEAILRILGTTGDKVGYTPAFRCLVKGMEPEQSIRWER